MTTLSPSKYTPPKPSVAPVVYEPVELALIPKRCSYMLASLTVLRNSSGASASAKAHVGAAMKLLSEVAGTSTASEDFIVQVFTNMFLARRHLDMIISRCRQSEDTRRVLLAVLFHLDRYQTAARIAIEESDGDLPGIAEEEFLEE